MFSTLCISYVGLSSRYGVDNFILLLEKRAATPQSAVLGRNALHTKLSVCSRAFDLMGPFREAWPSVEHSCLFRLLSTHSLVPRYCT